MIDLSQNDVMTLKKNFCETLWS